jgi:polyhydroxybutyrate depolymerase
VSSGQTRRFLLALPRGYDGTTAAPLVLDFHGSGSTMFGEAAYSGLATRGPAAGFVVVTPDGTGSPPGWNLLSTRVGNDFVFAHDLVTWAEQNLCIDPTRVDAAGISLGSELASLLACQPPHDFAAVGLVASEAAPTPACDATTLVSVIAFHGTADPVVPYGGGPVPSSGRGDRAFAPSTEATLAAWAGHDGCEAPPTKRRAAAHVGEQRWTGCRDGTAVKLYAVDGGGHTWPGGPDLSVTAAYSRLGATTEEINATELMLAFFSTHPRAGS